jgi:hypothetical protein
MVKEQILAKEHKNTPTGFRSGTFTRSRLYPPIVFALQVALGFSVVRLVVEGEVAKAVIVVVFLPSA